MNTIKMESLTTYIGEPPATPIQVNTSLTTDAKRSVAQVAMSYPTPKPNGYTDVNGWAVRYLPITTMAVFEETATYQEMLREALADLADKADDQARKAHEAQEAITLLRQEFTKEDEV